MQAFDLLIRNAQIVDGTGAPRFTGDIGIRGDRIEQIGDLSGRTGAREVDLHGRIAAPGFIDCHTHDDRVMLSGGEMAPKVSQGITTVIAGNCGISLAPMPRPIPQPVLGVTGDDRLLVGLATVDDDTIRTAVMVQSLA